MVGKDGLFFGVPGKAAFPLDGLGNETALGLFCGQDALIDAKYVQTLEVDVACFKQTHDLQAFRVAAIEFDGGVRNQQTVQDFYAAQVVQIMGVLLVDLVDSVHDLADFTHLVE